MVLLYNITSGKRTRVHTTALYWTFFLLHPVSSLFLWIILSLSKFCLIVTFLSLIWSFFCLFFNVLSRFVCLWIFPSLFILIWLFLNTFSLFKYNHVFSYLVYFSFLFSTFLPSSSCLYSFWRFLLWKCSSSLQDSQQTLEARVFHYLFAQHFLCFKIKSS